MVAVVDYGGQRVLEDDEKIRTSVIFEFQECGHYQEEEDVSIRSAALRADFPSGVGLPTVRGSSLDYGANH